MTFKALLQKYLSKQIKEPFTLETPPNPDFGDFSLPTFKLSKKAVQLEKELKLPPMVERIEVKGPYLNFFLKKDKLAGPVLKRILKEKDKYGSSSSGKGKKALIEHTSINPNASPHMGRSRNAMIGDTLTRLLRFEGYKTEAHYFVNDVGKQIAMLVLACKGKKPSFEKLLDLYISFNKKLQKDPGLEKKVFTLLHKVEQGDIKVRKQFKEVVNVCIQGQKHILSELDITFDHFDYESKYIYDKRSIPSVLASLEKTKRIFKDQEGRTTLNLEGFELPMENPYLPLTRADGTSLYMLRDIAYALEKIKKGKDRNLIVLGEDQKLYYLQLKAILSLLKKEAPEVVHYSFVLLKTGKMSTRKGNLVLLEDFMREAKEKALKEIKKRHNIKNEKTAKAIAYGAVKFGILKVSSDKNIIFDLDTALSFEGESGPYVQYSYARANSIVKKAKNDKTKPSYALLLAPSELRLVKKLAEFEGVVANSLTTLQPHHIANYALELAKNFNEFYHDSPVLVEDKELRAARLDLVKTSMQVLKNALTLLGIEAPQKM